MRTGSIERVFAVGVLACCMGIAPAARAQAHALEDLSLEDLVKLEVVSVSRKAQKISDTPAAVTVLTAEDIRRSGARSIPEALRLVPGVNVAQIGADRYAVSIRGFNGRFSNKLLVQVDGRSVYSPFYSGVFWESLNLMIEDIDRIEVVRGPGAALWGANAVNGIINVVSRRSSATQGVLVEGAVDDHGKPSGSLRYGSTLPQFGTWRVYATGQQASPSRLADGSEGGDETEGWRAGFRVDSAGTGTNSWTLQGEIFDKRIRDALLLSDISEVQRYLPADREFKFDGGHLLARGAREMAGGELLLQGYLDVLDLDISGVGSGRVTTADLDFQHRLAPWGRHVLLWGLGYRHLRTQLNDVGPVVRVSPATRRLKVTSAFVQDEVTLEPGVWKLTVGAKFEHSDLSGSELQPNLRLMWTPSAADSFWAAWSRAVRTPSVGEYDARFFVGPQPTPPGSPFPSVMVYSRRLADERARAERLDAAELGYRRNLGNGSVEAVVFAHRYDRLLGAATDPNGPVFPGTVGLPVPPFSLPDVYLNRGNLLDGRSHGLELGLDVPLTPKLRLHAGYTYLDLDLGHYADPVAEGTARSIERTDPRHSATLRLAAELGSGHELDVIARYVGASLSGTVPAYTGVDLRYRWKVNRNVELALIGQNLFDPLHVEYVSDFLPSKPMYQPRRAFLQGSWRF